MHLCVVSPFPPELTGVGQYGWNIVHGLAGTGRLDAITVLAQRAAADGSADAGRARRPENPTRVATQHVWSRDDLLLAPRLARHIRAAQPNAVWFNLGFTVFGASRPANFLGLMAPLLARQPKTRIVVTLHQLIEATVPNTIGAKNGHVTALGIRTATRLLLNADVVCVTLRSYQQILQTRYGARNVRHIPLGSYSGLEDLARPDHSLEENILSFGSAAPFKGLDVLLQAFDLLRARRPRATLTLAGADHPRFPGYMGALRALHESEHPAGDSAIHWLGAQTEAQVRGLFARARVAVLPYLATTGASSVLNRAAASGRPVVASDLPDLRAAQAEDGLWVDYVPPGDAPALAQALESLLADPRQQAARARHNLAAMRGKTLADTCARYLDLFAPAAA